MRNSANHAFSWICHTPSICKLGLTCHVMCVTAQCASKVCFRSLGRCGHPSQSWTVQYDRQTCCRQTDRQNNQTVRQTSNSSKITGDDKGEVWTVFIVPYNAPPISCTFVLHTSECYNSGFRFCKGQGPGLLASSKVHPDRQTSIWWQTFQQTDKGTDQTDRQTRQTDRQTDRHTDRQTNRQTDRQTADRQTDRQTSRRGDDKGEERTD